MVGEGVEEVVGMGVDVGAKMELEETGPVVVSSHQVLSLGCHLYNKSHSTIPLH